MIVSILVLLSILFSGCVQNIPLEKHCENNNDCVPAQCCHPISCIYKSQSPRCENIACTEECKLGTMDCGQGSCVCIDNQCQVRWKKIPLKKIIFP